MTSSLRNRISSSFVNFKKPADIHFNFDKIVHPAMNTLEFKDTIDDHGRHYSTHETISAGLGVSPKVRQITLPSVTTVLKHTMSDFKEKSLESWRQGVGEEVAQKTLEKAGKRGSALHECVEKYILGQRENFGYGDARFQSIYHSLKKINNIHAVESFMYSPRLGIAGRVDLIAEFDEKLSVIDFKTSSRYVQDYEIEDYYIQETMYALLFGDRMKELGIKGKNISQIVTLMVVDGSFGKPALEFVKKSVDYGSKAIDRIGAYYEKFPEKRPLELFIS